MSIQTRKLSPIRYPGGKFFAIPQILPRLPNDWETYYEPMVGGGSVFLYVRSLYPDRKFVINDLNSDVYYFWQQAKDNNSEVSEVYRSVRARPDDGKTIFKDVSKWDPTDPLGRAVRYFILNRMCFSGIVDGSGYSEHSNAHRFNEAAVKRFEAIKPLLVGIDIYNRDYGEILDMATERDFIFLDPPYKGNEASKLYGKKGSLHGSFDHKRFRDKMASCKAKFLITYNDCLEIRELFKDFKISGWDLTYCMKSFKGNKATVGKELFITNY
jgi:DNA adenine methylase